MSVNWVMISSDGKHPVPLPGEKVFFSQEKVSLILDMGGGYPGNHPNLKAEGIVFVTNQRIIFLSHPSLEHFKSLSIPLLNLKDGKFQQPWFAPNYYQATMIPVSNGGLTSPGELKITFKEGGGFEFSSYYKEVLKRHAEMEGTGPIEHLEPLPVYTPSSSSNSTSTQTPPVEATITSSSMSLPPHSPQSSSSTTHPITK
ncbi:4309_t:CDS:2 [Entrophospora sp. SA101]|nr:9807_t:CDS:2 [Entrophospora sp. SA101]CAJ0648938.1 4309_t:CDS:2 [Entrophospora sp. SA101]